MKCAHNAAPQQKLSFRNFGFSSENTIWRSQSVRFRLSRIRKKAPEIAAKLNSAATDQLLQLLSSRRTTRIPFAQKA
jgi:hypothetical protein